MIPALHIVLAALVAIWSPIKWLRNIAIGYAVTCTVAGLWIFRNWWVHYVLGPNPGFSFGLYCVFSICFVVGLIVLFNKWFMDGPLPVAKLSIKGSLYGLFWGTLQQATLLCVLTPLVGWKMAVGAFALLHLPNPFLFLVTLVGGSFSAWAWESGTARFLLLSGLSHAVLSAFVSHFFSKHLTLGMSVGLDAWRKMRIKEGW